MIDGYTVAMSLVIGSFAGFSAGLLGIGGGVVLVPSLSELVLPHLNIPDQVIPQLVRGTSVLVTLFAALSSTHRHHTGKRVLWKVVPFLALGSVFSAWVGASLAAHLSRSILRRIFGGVMVLVACRMFLGLESSSEETEVFNPLHLFLLGLVTGLIAALCGIGGGVVAVPGMVLLFHFPIKKVAGTSSATIVFTSLSGMLGYMYQGWAHPQLPPGTLGYVYWVLAIPLIASCMIFSQVGAAVNFRINPLPLRRIFGGVIGLVAIKMLVA